MEKMRVGQEVEKGWGNRTGIWELLEGGVVGEHNQHIFMIFSNN